MAVRAEHMQNDKVNAYVNDEVARFLVQSRRSLCRLWQGVHLQNRSGQSNGNKVDIAQDNAYDKVQCSSRASASGVKVDPAVHVRSDG